jgi:HEAT repeat protein
MKSILFALTLVGSIATTPHAAVAGTGQSYATTPRAAWADADPADSLYRAARSALTRKEFEAAAKMFDAIVTRYPKSEYAPDALYWKGFALYRAGNLDDAADALETQSMRFPNAVTRSDAASLLIQIKGQLAKRGDASAQRDVDNAAAGTSKGCGDMEMQIAALDALQQMDAERVMPLLAKVMARREPCSVKLRKNALFILAQKSGPDREKLLLTAAKTDPDAGVRQDAVFQLQQAKSEAAVDALEDLLLHSDDARVKENAIFALAQIKGDRARKILRAYALSNDASVKIRNDAVFQLSQGRDPADEAFLKELYAKVSEPELKSNVMFYMAQRGTPESTKWLASVVSDPNAAMEQRKNALFHLSQRKDGLDELIALFDKAPVALKKEMLFHIAQRRDAASLDKLISIAKTDPSIEVRKDALFHIGQSKDPKAIKALEDIVNP